MRRNPKRLRHQGNLEWLRLQCLRIISKTKQHHERSNPISYSERPESYWWGARHQGHHRQLNGGNRHCWDHRGGGHRVVLDASRQHDAEIVTYHLSPGFYEFRPFDGSQPLNANVYNIRRCRWRVDFFDQATGARIKLKPKRSANLGHITVAGASAFGRFVRLLPEHTSGNVDSDVGSERDGDQLQAVWRGGHRRVLVQPADLEHDARGAGQHERRDEVLRDGIELGWRERTEQHCDQPARDSAARSAYTSARGTDDGQHESDRGSNSDDYSNNQQRG